MRFSEYIEYANNFNLKDGKLLIFNVVSHTYLKLLEGLESM